MKRERIDFAALVRAAQPLMLPILRRILPDGRVHGREYVTLNPRRADRHIGSFSINLITGKWGDFASGDKGGDVISLVAFIENCSQLEAARLLSRMLSLESWDE
jgi:hypothetical protein